MRINTKIVWLIGTLEVLARECYDYVGRLALAKASSQETQIQGSEQSFFKQLQTDYSLQFSNQQQVLNALKLGFQPILSGGINQQGMSQSELASLKTEATDRTSAEYQKAATAVAERSAAAGGGNMYLPKGTDEAVQASIAAQAAGQISSENLAIDAKNYELGRQNFLTAASELGGVAQMYNPQSYGGLTSQTGSEAFNMANTIAQQNDTFGQVAGILGGAASSFLGGFGMGVGGGGKKP